MSDSPPRQNNPVSGKDVAAVLLGLLAVVYLVNPTAGVFELIPDNLPVVGNLDEAVATAILLAVLRHFGVDLTGGLLGSRTAEELPENLSSEPPAPSEE